MLEVGPLWNANTPRPSSRWLFKVPSFDEVLLRPHDDLLQPMQYVASELWQVPGGACSGAEFSHILPLWARCHRLHRRAKETNGESSRNLGGRRRQYQHHGDDLLAGRLWLEERLGLERDRSHRPLQETHQVSD